MEANLIELNLICFMSNISLSTSPTFALSLISLRELDGRRGYLRSHQWPDKRSMCQKPAAARMERSQAAPCKKVCLYIYMYLHLINLSYNFLDFLFLLSIDDMASGKW